jgi:hypothetical protein
VLGIFIRRGKLQGVLALIKANKRADYKFLAAEILWENINN